MIAQRFRALGWVAGIASAATGLYIVSLQVAAERAKLEAVDKRIAAAHRDMLQLKTELSTRASFRQLERWNDADLSLAAPRAAQYLRNETELASLTPDRLAPLPESTTPRAQLAAATNVPAAPAVETAPAPAPAPASLRNANYVTDGAAATPRPQRVAMIDRGTLGEIARTATTESRKRP